MPLIQISGNYRNGAYAVRCSCGVTWFGEVPENVTPARMRSPAIPVAEAAAHVSYIHQFDTTHMRCRPDFLQWLRTYWVDMNVQDNIHTSTFPDTHSQIEMIV
jgi:hypothetical protein